MFWSLSNVEYWTPSASWGQVKNPSGPLVGQISPTDQAAINGYLETLYQGSAKAASMFDTWTSAGNSIRIGEALESLSPGAALKTSAGAFVVYDLSAINQLYYFNDHGVLVQEKPALSVVHELSHMIDGTTDPTGPNGVLNDAVMNQANYDYKGDVLQEQNTVASQPGYTDNIQASYQATLESSDPLFGQFKTGVSYTEGNPIDDARIGTDGGDDMDHTARTDNSNDLFFGLGGNDKLFGGGGADYLYDGDGNDFLKAGSHRDQRAGLSRRRGRRRPVRPAQQPGQ